MKATIVLTGDAEMQNYGAKAMLAAHRCAGTGFEMARLPFHVSLKQPFAIRSLESAEEFFDSFALTVRPMELLFDDVLLFRNSVIGGVDSGCIMLRAAADERLPALQKRLFSQLEKAFGECPAEHDDDYIFHTTLAIGIAPYEKFEKAHRLLREGFTPVKFRFDRLSLFCYDDDAVSAGTYFCYKNIDL
ncbi:2'-5' RNA ligase family protein [Ruminococcus sp.]|uniref:2'-5' RNA ligase family protein n=1 Tax=Ruminococcus sp. TaxID=41978 RepID=UPI0025EB0EEE|nr:2'-5' RNA ligase family protein [Ruminococcus sp.]MBQ8965072.1 2'-5' RNA ligase family protein [Ruminococcus sp.]